MLSFNEVSRDKALHFRWRGSTQDTRWPQPTKRALRLTHTTHTTPTNARTQSKRRHHVLYLDGEEEWLELGSELVVFLRAARSTAITAGHFLTSEWLAGWLARTPLS